MVGNVLKLVKIGGGIIASAGATTVVEHAIKATTPAVTSTATKMLVKVGTVAIGGVVATQVMKSVEAQIDEIAAITGHLPHSEMDDVIVEEEV